MSEAKPKILIIDDEVVVLETIKVSLAHAGFEVETVQNPVESLAVVKAGKPDLIVLDLYMPEVNGLQLCRKLKADPETSAIPILILSGSSDTMDVVAGLDAGAYDYVGKPIDSDVLVAKIKSRFKSHAG